MNHFYGYSAPEILNYKKGKLSAKSDVFNIGAVFYFMLFGRHCLKMPFEKDHFCAADSYPSVDFSSA